MITARVLITVLILAGCFPTSLRGQSSQMLFRHFLTDDGLSHNTVYAINQDTLGFIWIGTRSGLNRFDGNGFRVYDLNQGLRDVYINTIFRDSRGILWVGTQQGGLARYDYTTDRFESWLISGNNGYPGRADNVLSIGEDPLGRIWLGDYNGEMRIFSGESQTFVSIVTVKENKDDRSPERINAMLFDSDSTVWVGSFSGLYRLVRTGSQGEIEYTIDRFLPAWINCLYLSDDSTLFAGTNEGVFILDGKGSVIRALTTANSNLSNNTVTDISRLPNGEILISTDGGGLNFFNRKSGEIHPCLNDPNNLQSLSNNSVYDIFQDKDGSIWVGNYLGGLNYFSPGDWKFISVRHRPDDPKSLSDNHVRCIFEDSEGKIWMGTFNGLNLYDRSSGKFTPFIPTGVGDRLVSSSVVLSVYEDSKGFLWIGTFNTGVFIFDRKNGRFSRYRHPDDINNTLERASIYQIADAGDNRIVLATLGGIYLIDNDSGKMNRYTSSNSPLSNNTVKAVIKDKKGRLWLGTNFGLNQFVPEDQSFRVFIHSNTLEGTLSNNRILSITEDASGLLWIGTEGGGVNILDPETETFTALTVSDGMPDNIVNSVVQDSHGVYWISTNKGLARYERESNRFSTYTASDGLQGNDFYPNSSLKSGDGSVFFGGPYGFSTFNPLQLPGSKSAPEVIFTDLYISGKLVRDFQKNTPVDKQIPLVSFIKLPYHSGLEVAFSVPGTPNKNKYQFSYMMKGLNDEWSDYQKINSVNFTNLHPGNYTLLLKAENNDGIESTSPAVLRIKILPPWWKTWWVFIIYAIFIGGLLTLLLWLNNSKIRARHELEIQRKEREQTELLNQMKMSFFTDISHEFKTPLTLILGHLDNLKDKMTSVNSRAFGMIESNTRRLLLLINQLLEFRKAEYGLMKLSATRGNIVTFTEGIVNSFSDHVLRKRIDLEMHSENDVPEVWFDEEKMEKIIFNLLSNAVRFTEEGGKISVIIKTLHGGESDGTTGNAKYVSVQVTDSGIGIPPEELPMVFERFFKGASDQKKASEGSGIGLALTKLLVDLHHGSISVRSTPGQGAEFTVILPAGNDHLTEAEMKEQPYFGYMIDYKLTDATDLEEITERQGQSPLDKKKPLMLVVDDNPAICNVLTEKFSPLFTVFSATDGKNGFQKARHYLPDIIISDIMMPMIDGYSFCQLVKSDISTSHIPVILLTAKSEDRDQIKGFTSGADAYLAKPYNPDLLSATVDNLLNNRRLLRKKYIGQSGMPAPEITENKLDEQFLTKLTNFIESEKFNEAGDVASLCNELGMSRSVLYRKVKMLTDSSIQDFIRNVKLRKAARHLTGTTKPISEIAFIAGFSNTKYFSTAFKKLFGKTPSEYRHPRTGA